MGFKNFITSLLFVWSIFVLNEFSIAQFSFVQITDLHVADGRLNAYHHDNNGVMFQKVLNAAKELTPKPAFVIATGDISNVGEGGSCTGSEGMYNAITSHLYTNRLLYPTPGDLFIDSSKNIPIYFAPGNHDYYTHLFHFKSKGSLAIFAKHISPDADYYIVKDNAVILFVRSGHDKHRPLKKKKDIIKPEATGLTTEQCTWIRNTLRMFADKRKIIVMHHPPVDANGVKADGSINTMIADTADGSLLNNRTMFLNICDSNHVDLVLAGHCHQNVVCNRAGTLVDNNWRLGTRYVQTGPGFAGCYRVITVDSDFVYVGIPQKTTSMLGIEYPSFFEEVFAAHNISPLFYHPFGDILPGIFNKNVSLF